MTETIALVSVITALCSVLLGPLVSMWVVQKQSRVSVLSGNRQAWINSLRDQISEFIAIIAVAHSGDWSSRTEKEYDDERKQLVLVYSKIELMLNPQEEDHAQLSTLMREATCTLAGRARSANEGDGERGAKIAAKIVPLAQSILKREWQRVKQTE